MLWTEKYRPSKLDDIVGQFNFTQDAKTWKDGMPNLLLFGEAGIGKTAGAVVVANLVLGENMNGNFFEINASDDRRLEVVRTTIKDIASSMKIGDVPHKIILLDEMDGMTPDAQNAMKRLMERYSNNVRFIITCNHRHKIIYPLQSRCANYRFRKLSNSEMYAVLERILLLEGVEGIEQKELESFIEVCRGDLRGAITQLQASVFSNTPITKQIERIHEPYREILDMILIKKFDNAHDSVMELVGQSVDMKTICVNLHDVIINDSRRDGGGMKFKLLRVIGEAEWRSSNMTPKVLASWMIGQMI